MKILFFIHGLYGGGAERVASILLNHFCEKHDTYVAVTNFKAPFYHLDSRVHLIDDRTKRILKGFMKIPRFLKMAHTIRKIKPDIIISFLVTGNNNALAANLFCKRRIIVSERNTYKREKSMKHRILRRILYPMADKVVFVTKDDCEKFRFPKKRLTIYNPAMYDIYADYSNRTKTIVTIAPNTRWHNKGLDILLKAWAKIESKKADWDLKIYGRIYGDLPQELTSLPHERVTWAGWTDNIADILQKTSIFILASRIEGCPNSLIEAMSQGCACIVTDCEGESKVMIDNGINGLIAKSENVDDIAQKLQMLIDNENLRHRLSSAATEKAKLFDKNVFFAKWDKLIEEVAEK
ncbi:MAG: glycosyltransferase [Salinivirgaceae bacterium]|nr:glycosyltransferase [Salinivirgaceae bacterium]